jgi:transcriptional regulator with XRE-family HTH domain
MDATGVGTFLRTRREALQPEDVGLPRGQRRRTSGLRREEVAALVGMSPDYYARLERGAGPQPSEQMVAAIARGLRLSLVERDHLFTLTDHIAPRSTARGDHVGPGLMRVLDRLQDTPAQVMGSLGETLIQTPLAVALLGDQTHYTGLNRSVVYRWFTDLASRDIYLAEDHDLHGRTFTAHLRQAVTSRGPKSAAADLARQLQAISAEFTAVWNEHEVGLNFAATPGSPSSDTLQLLAVVGHTALAT